MSIGEFCKRLITERRRQVITDLLVDFIVKNVRPLSAVSGEGFRGIINFFEPSYTVPSKATLWKIIGHKYDSLKADNASEMKSKNISLTTDLWTSCTMDPYITITAHYMGVEIKGVRHHYHARETHCCQHYTEAHRNH